MKYALTIIIIITIILLPNTVTTANRATAYKPKPKQKTVAAEPKAATKKQKFVTDLHGQVLVAIQIAKQSGYKTPLPETIIKQVLLETGYGTKYAHNNLGGVRAKKGEPFFLGYDDGAWRRFKRYPTKVACLGDMIRIYNSPRYKRVFNENTVYGQALALQQGGYATNKRYAKLLAGVKLN